MTSSKLSLIAVDFAAAAAALKERGLSDVGDTLSGSAGFFAIWL